MGFGPYKRYANVSCAGLTSETGIMANFGETDSVHLCSMDIQWIFNLTQWINIFIGMSNFGYSVEWFEGESGIFLSDNVSTLLPMQDLCHPRMDNKRCMLAYMGSLHFELCLGSFFPIINDTSLFRVTNMWLWNG